MPALKRACWPRGQALSLLAADGRLFAFGCNEAGQCGVAGGEGPGQAGGGWLAVPAHVPLPGRPVRDVSCGDQHTLALCEGGDVLSCGSNAHGQLGQRADGAGGAIAGTTLAAVAIQAGAVGGGSA